MYKDKKDIDLFIYVVNFKGDLEISNFIKNQLKIASDVNSTKKHEINFESKYEKIILAKDSTGKATDYKLNMSVKFQLLSKNNKEINFNQNFKIKSTENFEQSNYEKEIKRNFSKAAKDELIRNLINLNDN
ncbi:LPS assembly lipoprotein LptE [Candidatus Pelagibacter sp. HIMB1593]|uniref:LPS assembly lipoprotein LptE n=1 Tax=Candidatus Pelagibacter sp. HIMB1593 TaxID=3413355 RepID=UPI003F825AC9